MAWQIIFSSKVLFFLQKCKDITTFTFSKSASQEIIQVMKKKNSFVFMDAENFQ